MTLIEAAAILGVTADTLRQQIANGKLTATKRGRDWWVSKGEVARYGKERKPVTKRTISTWRCALCGALLRRVTPEDERVKCGRCGIEWEVNR